MMNNPLSNYDASIVELAQTPQDASLQHRAVLALTRAGSLDFAEAEYARFGLDRFRDHKDLVLLEDIMALEGRLLKDRFLGTLNGQKINYARQSSEAYEAAYKETKGYYSGINAATMALMAGMPNAIITHRAEDILRVLPRIEATDGEALYFIEATRAEALLLLGKPHEAQTSLRRAIQHDPRHYTAHAATLKQFRMILEAQEDTTNWLSSFEPPKPMHFAGHIFRTGTWSKVGSMTPAEQEALRISISDKLQMNDIGFGYGSLAAGADICIAEALLDEGCELHVILPVPMDKFITHSVEPFGEDWMVRFSECWDAATSHVIAAPDALWPHYETDHFAGKIAMGKARLQADYLSVEPAQLLLWDGQPSERGTGRHAADWAGSGGRQFVLPYLKSRRVKHTWSDKNDTVNIRVILCNHADGSTAEYTQIEDAIDAAISHREANPKTTKMGLHIDIAQDDLTTFDTAEKLAKAAVPGGILLSESANSFLQLSQKTNQSVYMGAVDGHNIFALKS
ncbi:MAG: tetratricopeptide repeat-containing protein [Maricaulaceae bacterium]